MSFKVGQKEHGRRIRQITRESMPKQWTKVRSVYEELQRAGADSFT